MGFRRSHRPYYQPFHHQAGGPGTGLGLFVSYGIITSCGTFEARPLTTALGKRRDPFTVKLPTGSAEDVTKTADAPVHRSKG
jgi:hypothetical protein